MLQLWRNIYETATESGMWRAVEIMGHKCVRNVELDNI
jgi:hypothetical protein